MFEPLSSTWGVRVASSLVVLSLPSESRALLSHSGGDIDIDLASVLAGPDPPRILPARQ